MTFPSNAHTHSRWCDGADVIPAMVEAARALGFVSLGFSGHACQGFDPDYSMAPDVQAGYFAELRALQAAPEPGFPRLWAGLELDALAHPDCRRAAWCRSGLPHRLGALPVRKLRRRARGRGPGDPCCCAAMWMRCTMATGLAMARDYFAIEITSLLRDRPPDHRPL